MSSLAIHRIIIHCATTPNGRVLGRDGENAAQVIDRWHRRAVFTVTPRPMITA